MIRSSVLPGCPTLAPVLGLVIDHSVVLTQDETSLAFRGLQGSVTAHYKCGFNRQEMAVLQSGSNTGSWRKCEWGGHVS